jgi:hypothetical protein
VQCGQGRLGAVVALSTLAGLVGSPYCRQTQPVSCWVFRVVTSWLLLLGSRAGVVFGLGLLVGCSLHCQLGSVYEQDRGLPDSPTKVER